MAAIKHPTPGQVAAYTLLAAAFLAAVICTMTMIGSTWQDVSLALAGEYPQNLILFHLRLPRVLLASLAGGALAVAGLLFQTLVRNSLAEPYTLGVASGGSLGAVLAICFGAREAIGMSVIGASAFVGASVTLLIVLAIASRGDRLSSFTLLLAGVAVNSICMAAVLFLHHIANFSEMFVISQWLMGGIDSVDYPSLAGLGAVEIGVLLFLFFRAREWNLLAVGEDWVEARGVAARPLIISGFLAGSLLTASVTAFTGPIVFLGLIVPHALRLRLGADHRILIPVAFLAGASFLAICDTIARTVLAPVDIPVGVITAMLGGPFFIWLLISRRRGPRL